jgi:phage baseplate assembly protein W
MAFEVQRKAVIDRDEFEDFALGLKSEIRRGNGGYFEQNFTTIDQAKSNVINLLKTKKGERVMHPDFGSGLHSLIFEQIDTDDFEDRILNEIETALQRWLPYITIDSIDVDLSNSNIDRNKVDVILSFKLSNQLETNTVTIAITE